MNHTATTTRLALPECPACGTHDCCDCCIDCGGTTRHDGLGGCVCDATDHIDYLDRTDDAYEHDI